MLIRNGLVFTEENIFSPLTIQTNGDKITALSASGFSSALIDTEETIIDASGCYVIPGLTDIHFHGVCGYDFCDDSFEAYEAITKFCLINGVTSICPATMTLPEAKLEHICRTAASFYKRQQLDSAFTQADYKTAKAAMDAGALHVTHLFNAMPSFHHRDTGVIGAAADTTDCYAELICDGIHVSAPAVRAAFKLFENRIILISDSMRATGKPDGTYTLGGQAVTVKGRYATLDDDTLAGSVTPLFECLKVAVSMGIPLEAAVAAATINPCRSIGMDHLYGSILPGKKAHFLLSVS